MIRKGIAILAATLVLLMSSIAIASADGGNRFEHQAQRQSIQAEMGQLQSIFTSVSG